MIGDVITDVLEVAGRASLLDDDMLRFVTATNETVEEVERIQASFDEGPCRDAA